jgi:hypothetical protein
LPDAVPPVHLRLGPDNVKLSIIAASVTALTPAHLMPWWAYFIVMLACVVNGICRALIKFRLCSKALDKAKPAQVPAIMRAAFAQRREFRGIRKRSIDER